MMMKRINGYEELYAVGEDGEIYSFTTKKFRKISISHGRYKRIDLYKEGNFKMFSVHRLVAERFVKNPYKKPCVNHIDGNKLNNHYTNLEWCTHKENMKHALDNNLMSRKMTDEKIKYMCKLFKAGFYGSEIAILLEVDEHTICKYKKEHCK